ncbi:hypothetical protein KSD_82340 [Ktedonobacter sp. SOSP1-85]|uniref:hypothetical protein n=1 Tax=Ktedonobacter sp. SOSP1-85 TaxID=2778367 RepID=UPI0019164B3E|nr:hypothetical protein [Ktedonobacter sp. SOSP1-85]GHO80463.1 hypothetical protein KSD_82340 [Ktedonobacter sp. SOSP1-85]
MPSIRHAQRTGSSLLTALVRTSHAYDGQYHAMVKNIDITSEQIEKDSVYACEIDERIVGFYSLLPIVEEAEDGRSRAPHLRCRASCPSSERLRCVPPTYLTRSRL